MSCLSVRNIIQRGKSDERFNLLKGDRACHLTLLRDPEFLPALVTSWQEAADIHESVWGHLTTLPSDCTSASLDHQNKGSECDSSAVAAAFLRNICWKKTEGGNPFESLSKAQEACERRFKGLWKAVKRRSKNIEKLFWNVFYRSPKSFEQSRKNL